MTNTRTVLLSYAMLIGDVTFEFMRTMRTRSQANDVRVLMNPGSDNEAWWEVFHDTFECGLGAGGNAESNVLTALDSCDDLLRQTTGATWHLCEVYDCDGGSLIDDWPIARMSRDEQYTLCERLLASAVGDADAFRAHRDMLGLTPTVDIRGMGVVARCH